ncbi:hypothetical protein B6D29_04755 [Microgenomates bacterium UTCPR1]|nr:MAG: hypothetical protein B6D29_04755 [Microgenomates bacterium UTCPR1]
MLHIQQRLDRLRKALKEKKLDAILVSNFFNILYLSEFKTLTENERESWLLLTADSCYVFSDSRYLDSKVLENNFITYLLISPENNLINYLDNIFKKERLVSCAIEEYDLKLYEFNLLKKYLQNISFIPTRQIIIRLRETKDNDEIQKIKKACEISDDCLKEVSKIITVGMMEKEIAFKMEFFIKEKGYDTSFYPIVAIDRNSAIAHYDTKINGNEKVKIGSVILIDFGVKFQNYCSDITRMFFVGQVDTQIINTYNNLKASQQSLFQKGIVSQGKKLSDVDKYCRKLIADYELPDYSHSTGHGVGLEVHEYPKISSFSEDLSKKNQVVTIEPGVYFEGKWGMRVEDTVIVNEDGLEALTKFDKEPFLIKE